MTPWSFCVFNSISTLNFDNLNLKNKKQKTKPNFLFPSEVGLKVAALVLTGLFDFLQASFSSACLLLWSEES